VSRDREDADTVAHDDVFTLTKDSKAGFLQRTDGILMPAMLGTLRR